MVSFQQQWEAAMDAETRERPRSPFRHAAILLVIALVLITGPTIALARATESRPPMQALHARMQESPARAHGCEAAYRFRDVCVSGATRAAVRP